MILFIGHEGSLTGAPIFLLRIIKYIKAQTAEEIHVILKKGGDLENEYQKYSDKTTIWHVDWYYEKNIIKKLKNRILNNNRRQKSIQDFYSKNKPKIIFNNTAGNGIILKKLFNADVPVISFIHELQSVINMHYIYSEETTFLFENTKEFITPSKATKNNLSKNNNICLNKINICYGSSSIISENIETLKGNIGLKKQLKINDKTFLIGACGTLGWRKGSDLFLKVCKQLKAEDNFKFIWIGINKNSQSYNEFMYEANKYKLGDQLITIPHEQDIGKYYKLLDLFLMTSREDPFPLVNLEVAEFGVPIICFKDSGGSEEFVEENSGFIVPYGDTTKMSQKALEIYKSPKVRSRLENGIRKQSRKFNNHNSLDKIWEIIFKYL
jgi:glycosyltransferase involved in cell wall biosynthesis